MPFGYLKRIQYRKKSYLDKLQLKKIKLSIYVYIKKEKYS